MKVTAGDAEVEITQFGDGAPLPESDVDIDWVPPREHKLSQAPVKSREEQFAEMMRLATGRDRETVNFGPEAARTGPPLPGIPEGNWCLGENSED